MIPLFGKPIRSTRPTAAMINFNSKPIQQVLVRYNGQQDREESRFSFALRVRQNLTT